MPEHESRRQQAETANTVVAATWPDKGPVTTVVRVELAIEGIVQEHAPT
jgi:hypothetical protein